MATRIGEIFFLTAPPKSAAVLTSLSVKKTAFANAYATSQLSTHSGIDITVKHKKRADLEHDVESRE